MSEREQSPGSGSFEQAKMYADLSPAQRPVEIQEGREDAGRVTEILAEMKDLYLEQLPLGEKTKLRTQATLARMLENPSSVLIDRQQQARNLRLTTANEHGRISGRGGEPTIEVGQPMLEASQEWMNEACDRVGLDLSPELIKGAADRWLVYHEVAHLIQNSYGEVADPQTFGAEGQFQNEAKLQDDSLNWGISEPWFERDLLENSSIESERFAEGFGQMMAIKYLQDNVEMSDVKLQDLRGELTPQERKQKAAETDDIYRQNEAGLEVRDNQTVEKVNVELNEKRLSHKVIGYANPYPPEQVMDILSLTGRLESIPWQDRIKGR